MKKTLLVLSLPILLLAGCSVHEWPSLPESVNLCLHLDYESEFQIWEHYYDGQEIIEIGDGDVYDNEQEYGTIRYIIRAYPINGDGRESQDFVKEFVFAKDLYSGYDHTVDLEIPGGSYDLRVWSDVVPVGANPYFYDASNFSHITLAGDYVGNTDYRDAFRGTGRLTLTPDILDAAPDTMTITMQRPLAKYEILSTDLQEFYVKEYEYLQNEAQTKGEDDPIQVNTDDYRVVFYYAGYMPDTYNMLTDKPVDARLGVMFETKLTVLNDNEASLGFDYVFVNNMNSAVTFQVGLYANKDNRQVALSNPMNLPLLRSRHTLLKGSFLIQQASGGINIDSDFDGDHNFVIE